MAPSLAEILNEYVTVELESIDRLYLSGYVPGLQTPAAVAYFLRQQRGTKFASSVLLPEISRDYARRIGLGFCFHTRPCGKSELQPSRFFLQIGAFL